MATKVGELFVQLGMDTSEVSKGLSGVENSIKNVAKAVAASAIAKTVIDIGKAAIEVGANFQAGMSEVAAISGATGDDLAALTAKAKEMGASTKFSATESAEALKYMAMAGWDTEQMISGLPGVMDLAAASGERLGTVSDIVTDALTAFGMQAEDSAHFADVLAVASSNSNTNVGMMGETFKYVAPIAGAMSYSIEDTALAIGLMANSGIKASQAGTSLRQTLLGLGAGVTITSKKMGEMRVETQNADGTMRPLGDVIKDLRTAFSHLTDAEKSAAAEAISGKIGMSGLLAIVNAAEPDVQKLANAIENSAGATEEMARIMNDNLKGDIVILQSALEGLGIQIFESFESPLRAAVQAAQGAAEELSKVFDTPETQASMAAIGQAIKDVIVIGVELAEETIPIIVNALGVLASHSDAIISTITGIGAAMVAFKAITIIQKAVGVFAAANKAAQLFARGATLAQFASAGVATSTTIMGAAVAGATGKITLADAATKIWNLTLLSNPIMIVALAIGALVGGIMLYDRHMKKATAEAREFNEAMKEQAEQAQKTLEEVREQSVAFNESITAMRENNEVVDAYTEKLFSLVDAQGRLIDSDGNSAAKKAELLNAIEQLNEAVPGLNLAYDEQANALNMANAEIERSIGLHKQEAEVAAYQEVYNNHLKQRAELSVQLAAADENVAAAQRNYNEALAALKSMPDDKMATRADTKNLELLSEAIDNARVQSEGYGEAILENEQKIRIAGDALDEAVAKHSEMSEAFETVTDSTEEARSAWQRYVDTLSEDEQKDELKKHEKELDSWASAAGSAFKKVETKSKTSFKSMKEALEHNRKALEGYNENYQYLLDTIGQSPEGQDMLDYLDKLAPEARMQQVKRLADSLQSSNEDAVASTNQLIKDISEELHGLDSAMVEAAESGLNRFAEGWLANEPAIEAAAESAGRTVDAAVNAVEDADLFGEGYEQGENLGEGVAQGAESKIGRVESAASSVARAGLNASARTFDIHSPSKAMFRQGDYAMEGLALGIESKKKRVEEAVKTVVYDGILIAEEGVEKLSGAGKKGGQNYADGLLSQSDTVADAVAQLGGKNLEKVEEWLKDKDNKIKLSTQEEAQLYFAMAEQYGQSTEKRAEFENAALDATRSYLSDLEKENKATAQEIATSWMTLSQRYTDMPALQKQVNQEVLSSVKDAVSEMQDIYAVSAKDIAQIWDQVRQGMPLWTSERAEADKQYFGALKDFLEEHKEQTKVTTQEEVEYWQEAAKQFEKGTAMRLEAEKELATAQKQLREEEKQADKERLDAARSYVSERVSLYAAASKRIMEFWAQERKSYAEGSKERLEADKEYLSATKAWVSERKELVGMSAKEEKDFWEKAVKDYKKGTAARIDAEKELLAAKKNLWAEEKQTQLESLKYQEEIRLASLKHEMDTKEELHKEQLKAAEDAAKAETKLAKEESEERIKQYEYEYNRKLSALDAETAAQIAAVQGQIDAIDAQTAMEDEAKRLAQYNEKLVALQNKLAAATAEDRAEIQKQINEMIAEENRRHELKQREEQKKALKQEIDAIKAVSNSKKDILKADHDALIESEKMGTEATIEEINRRAEAVKAGYESQYQAAKYAYEQSVLATQHSFEQQAQAAEDAYEAQVKAAGEAFLEQSEKASKSFKGSMSDVEKASLDTMDGLQKGLGKDLEKIVNLFGKKGEEAAKKFLKAMESINLDGMGDNPFIDFSSDPSLLDSLPKFHTGGIYRSMKAQKEGLAILQDREMTLTEMQQKRLFQLLDGSKNSLSHEKKGEPANSDSMPDPLVVNIVLNNAAFADESMLQKLVTLAKKEFGASMAADIRFKDRLVT